jgi:hypothetical protein
MLVLQQSETISSLCHLVGPEILITTALLLLKVSAVVYTMFKLYNGLQYYVISYVSSSFNDQILLL